jgi:hypothetical protein
MSIYVRLQVRITGLLYLLWVATQASNEAVVCHDWAALKDAIQKGQTFAYEFDRKQLHIWHGTPNRGDRCQCGQRTWA